MTAPAGFEEFVRDQSRALLRTAWLLTGNWASAEDVVQSALATSWVRWDSIRGKDSPSAYVRKVVLTTFLSSHRRRWTGEIPTAQLPEQADEVFAAVDRRQLLERALQQLPPRQRAVVALRYFEDLPERDTAEALGCSVGTVKSTASKALARLRDMAELKDLLDEGVPG